MDLDGHSLVALMAVCRPWLRELTAGPGAERLWRYAYLHRWSLPVESPHTLSSSWPRSVAGPASVQWRQCFVARAERTKLAGIIAAVQTDFHFFIRPATRGVRSAEVTLQHLEADGMTLSLEGRLEANEHLWSGYATLHKLCPGIPSERRDWLGFSRRGYVTHDVAATIILSLLTQFPGASIRCEFPKASIHFGPSAVLTCRKLVCTIQGAHSRYRPPCL